MKKKNIHLSCHCFADHLCCPPPSQYSFPLFQESLTCSEAERSSLSPCGHLTAALHLLYGITATKKIKKTNKLSHESLSGAHVSVLRASGLSLDLALKL